MDEFLKSLKAWLYEKTSNPFFFIFLLSWAALNHRLLIVAFSQGDLTEKLNLVTALYVDAPETLLPFWGIQIPLKKICYMLIYPFVIFIFAAVFYPPISNAASLLHKWYENRFAKWRLRLENEQPVNQEEFRNLYARSISQEENARKLELEKNIEIAELRKTIADLHRTQSEANSGDGSISKVNEKPPSSKWPPTQAAILALLKMNKDGGGAGIEGVLLVQTAIRLLGIPRSEAEYGFADLQQKQMLTASNVRGISLWTLSYTGMGEAIDMPLDATPGAKQVEEEVRKYTSGMKKIEYGALDSIKSQGELSSALFVWNGNEPVIPIPETLHLTVLLRGNQSSVTFTKDEVTDSASGLSRQDVLDKISQVLAPLIAG